LTWNSSPRGSRLINNSVISQLRNHSSSMTWQNIVSYKPR
jgi:hypothetical protein